MSELSRITEQLLDEGRHGHDPDAAQIEQTLHALHAQLDFRGEPARTRRVASAAAAALAADAVVASTSKAASAITGKVILKLVIAGVALGGSVTTAMVVHDRAPKIAAIEQVQPAPREHHVASQPPPERAPLQPIEVAEPVVETAPLAPAPEPARKPRRHGELSLIGRALASLRDGEPQRALALLDAHAKRHPHGTFATERAGLRVLALCAAGRGEEAQRERATFLRESARAPIAARVRAACDEER